MKSWKNQNQNKFWKNSSIKHIKEITSDGKCSFQHALSLETNQTIMKLKKNKSNSGNIPTKTLKTIAQDICIHLNDCINSAILNGAFPDKLKLIDVTSLCKKSDPAIRTNYQLISILASLCKVYDYEVYGGDYNVWKIIKSTLPNRYQIIYQRIKLGPVSNNYWSFPKFHTWASFL